MEVVRLDIVLGAMLFGVVPLMTLDRREVLLCSFVIVIVM